MTSVTVKTQATAQANYMQLMIKKATEKALGNLDKLAFDPQGRVLIDVTLDNEELQNLKIGKKASPTTTISLDCTIDPRLNAQFKKQLETALKAIIPAPKVMAAGSNNVPRVDQVMSALNAQPKSSIIALQQELHFHLSLVSRVYQKSIPALKGKENIGVIMKQVHEETMLEVNKLVMSTYAKALKEATIKGPHNKPVLDTSKLNVLLDKAREQLLPQTHDIMRKNISKYTGIEFTVKELKKAGIKKIAESMTATPNDILHLDANQGLATLISGSEYTAHDRIPGDKFAHRQLIAHRLNADGTVLANNNPRIQIRTPSPVLKQKKEFPKGEEVNEASYTLDVSEKLKAINTVYQLTEKLDDPAQDSQKPRAFIYNSYTAINDRPDDIFRDNFQSQSANHILKGAHYYNRKQSREDKPVFCFVQNISVNGAGDTLGYKNFLGFNANDLKRESTMMSEMALLHTLYDSAIPADKEKMDTIFKKYQDYVFKFDNDSPPFSNSKEGREAISSIEALKTKWQKPLDPISPDLPAKDRALLGLKKLMAHNLHFTHEHSKLFQALSVFTENASIGGCKSGNERAQAINGRVAMLDSLSNTKKADLTEIQKNIDQALNDFLASKDQKASLKNARTLSDVLSGKYDTALQAGASVVSLVDQGAAAKLEAQSYDSAVNISNRVKESIQSAIGFEFPATVISTIVWAAVAIREFFTSRNYGEERAAIMTNLHQNKSGAMQAHKGLTDNMNAACNKFDNLPEKAIKPEAEPLLDKGPRHAAGSMAKAHAILSASSKANGLSPSNNNNDEDVLAPPPKPEQGVVVVITPAAQPPTAEAAEPPSQSLGL